MEVAAPTTRRNTAVADGPALITSLRSQVDLQLLGTQVRATGTSFDAI